VTIKTVTSIVYNCTTAFSLSLSDANATGYQLSGTAGSLTYGLFQDSARTIPWGNGTNGGNPQTGSGSGSVLIYASLLVPAATTIGSYTDSVNLTVSF
jgi:spore coat protein U-like protein